MNKKQCIFKMNKQFVIVALLLFFVSATAVGQDYETAVGVRGGFPTGLNGKHFFKKNTAVEAILTGYGGGFEFTGLYEIHANAFDVPYLNWYYGPGAHVNFFSDNVIRPGYFYNGRAAGFSVGLDGILGIEYTLTEIPFVLGFDVKPALDFLPEPYIYVGFGMSVRYYF